MAENEQEVDAVEERLGYSPEVDWSQWDDGRIHTLTRVGSRARRPKGEPADTYHLNVFEQPARQARRAFLSWARRRNVGTHSKVIDENTVKVQVTPVRNTRVPRRAKKAAKAETCGAGQ